VNDVVCDLDAVSVIIDPRVGGAAYKRATHESSLATVVDCTTARTKSVPISGGAGATPQQMW
jgi:hypothetical protein